MKRNMTKIISFVLLAVIGLTALAGCTKNEADQADYELSTYRGELIDEKTGLSLYNPDLFYRNDFVFNSPDPFILDDTSRSGYYYLYSTTGRIIAYRSKDLAKWESIGSTLSFYDNKPTSNFSLTYDIAREAIWAPEVIYDPDTSLYYCFFSAAPALDKNVIAEGDGVQLTSPSAGLYNTYVATSPSPEGPFELVDFLDETAIEEGYNHTYNVETGKTVVEEDSTEMLDTKGFVYAYPQYYAKYSYFDPQELRYAINELQGEGIGFRRPEDMMRNAGFIETIDPHPFIDTNGDKYLYWVNIYIDGMGGRIFGMKMKEDENGNSSWLNPDWSTMQALTMTTFYTYQDYVNYVNGTEPEERVPYESNSSRCNEGPQMLFHNGKYYLVYSANGWKDGTYLVGQAVSDSPLGPFRKLTLEENGAVLSGDNGAAYKIVAPGHNSFVKVGDKLYMCYHKFRNYNNISSGGRYACLDEMKWVSVTNKDGEPMDVLYINGATISEQPIVIGEYANIAEEAQIELQSGTLSNSSINYLNDGLLSIYTSINASFVDTYVKETMISSTSTFKLTFDDLKTVRAVMVYNSKNTENLFFKVSKIDLVCDENGETVTYRISDLMYDLDKYTDYSQIDGNNIYISHVDKGTSVYAEFAEKKVKEILITVDVPNGKTVGISEIRVLGK